VVVDNDKQADNGTEYSQGVYSKKKPAVGKPMLLVVYATAAHSFKIRKGSQQGSRKRDNRK
jgi:hypothetical protein